LTLLERLPLIERMRLMAEEETPNGVRAYRQQDVLALARYARDLEASREHAWSLLGEAWPGQAKLP
jgi:hypothetical protein